MLRLALVFVDIALHRKGPEDLPPSRFFFGLILLVYATVSLLALQINWPLSRALSMLVVDLALYLSFYWALLSLTRHSGRYWQTVTAVLGAETLLNVLAVPILLWRGTNPEQDATAAVQTGALALLLMWSIDIAGFVVARAIDKPYIVGVLIMVGYVVGSILLGQLLFPAAP